MSRYVLMIHFLLFGILLAAGGRLYEQIQINRALVHRIEQLEKAQEKWCPSKVQGLQYINSLWRDQPRRASAMLVCFYRKGGTT